MEWTGTDMGWSRMGTGMGREYMGWSRMGSTTTADTIPSWAFLDTSWQNFKFFPCGFVVHLSRPQALLPILAQSAPNGPTGPHARVVYDVHLAD